MTVRSRNLLLVAAAWIVGMAADWPQWRGPNRDGVSAEKDLLAEWPKDGPRLLWQVSDAGEGYSTPAVAGEHLYLVSSQGTEKETVQARRVADGTLAWETPIGKVGKPDQQPSYPGARSTPTVDGTRVFALGSDGDLVCLDRATGKVQWAKNVREAFGGSSGKWAYSESPLVDGDTLVCAPGGSEATLLALNKSTGELIWKSAVPGGDDAGYASTIITEPEGVKQYVQFLGKGVVGVEARSGRFLWRYDRTGTGPSNIPTPVAAEPYLYTSGGRAGGALLKLAAKGNTFEAVEQYYSPKLPTSIGGSVKVGDYLYGTNSGGLMCVEFATGVIKWQDRCVGAGSVCFADGRLYVHGEDNGTVALVEATPEAYREKGRFTPPNRPERKGKAWTYPVVANGRLYLRDNRAMWCYDVKAGN